MNKNDIDRTLSSSEFCDLARLQSGLVTSKQLRRFGLNNINIAALASGGRFASVYKGVFEVAKTEDRFARALWLAVLRVKGAVVSHRAAAKLHGLDGINAAPPEVWARTWRKQHMGLKTHRLIKRLSPDQTVTIDGLPVTNLERTLLDLAAVVNEEQLAYAVEHAWREDKTDPQRLRLALLRHRSRGVEGVVKLENVLHDCESRGRTMDSALEVRVWRLLNRERIKSDPQCEMDNGLIRLDFAFHEERVTLEAIGIDVHGTPEAAEKDSRRMARLTAMGWMETRVTWRMLEEDTAGFLARLRATLARRRAELLPLKLCPVGSDCPMAAESRPSLMRSEVPTERRAA